MKPFRWNLKKREQLGRLLKGERAQAYRGYHHDIRVCAAKVFGRSDNRRIIIIGRSPQNIFDYLSGILHNTYLENDIDTLNISNRFYDIKKLSKELPASYKALQEHFIALNISPQQLISSKRGVCFVDLVCEGFTFDRLYEFIAKWCCDDRIDPLAVWKKIKLLGITSQTKNSPNTFRWYQHTIWLDDTSRIKTQSVSISQTMWQYMGNRQLKSSHTNKPETWNKEVILLPPRDKEQLEALRFAYDLYIQGLQEKNLFSKALAMCPEYKEPWLRKASLNIKRSKA